MTTTESKDTTILTPSEIQRFRRLFSAMPYGAAVQPTSEIRTLDDVFTWLDAFCTVLQQTGARENKLQAEALQIHGEIRAAGALLTRMLGNGRGFFDGPATDLDGKPL